MRHRRATDEESGVDLTPMLDIVFIMLIFFIVTATFVQEEGLDVTSPDQDEEQKISAIPAIVVAVDDNNSIFFEDRRIDVRAVRANVERKLAENPKSPVVIQAGTQTDAGVVVRVMDQAKAANAPAVTIQAPR